MFRQLTPAARHLAAIDWLEEKAPELLAPGDVPELLAVDERGFLHRPAGSPATPHCERFYQARLTAWIARANNQLQIDPQRAAAVLAAYRRRH